MNSTNNDFYKNAASKVFAQLGQLIEEDENKTNKMNDKPIKSNKLIGCGLSSISFDITFLFVVIFSSSSINRPSCANTFKAAFL